MVPHINKTLLASIFFLFTLLGFSGAFAQTYSTEDHTVSFEEMYESIYYDLKNGSPELNETATFYVGGAMGISSETVKQILQEDPTQCGNNCLAQKYCGTNNGIQATIDCKNKISNQISERKEQLLQEKSFHDYALSTQAFVNGTLQDTGGKTFDLVVDLNIVDLLLFGEKMTVPQNGSPFLPKNETGENASKITGEPIIEYIESSQSGGNNENNQNNNTGNNSNNNAENGNPPEEFCMAEDSFDAEFSDAFTIIGENLQEEVSEEQQTRLGNIIEEKYKFSGGTYPDLSRFKKKKKCGEGEKSYFGGRICIPEFCNEIICIKIDLKTQEKPKSTSKLNCTECNIDRALEALDSLMKTLGQNTPNANPMEPFFSRAIANLFKPISNNITMIAKPLPFLVYDEALVQDKEESKKPEEEKIKKQDEDLKAKILATNKQLYTDIILECPELIEHFGNETIGFDEIVGYCQKVDNERVGIGIVKKAKTQVAETENEQKSISHQKLIKPFYDTMNSKMVGINENLQEISAAEIQKTNRNCKTTLNQ